MDMGLLTSYVVGGLLLISILTLNMSVSNNSTELTLNQTTREKMEGVKELLSRDIQKIGYNRNNKTSPILEIADSNKIQFRSNIDNSYDNSVEQVTWELTSTALGNGNPDAYVLKRTVTDLATGTVNTTPIRLGVTNFNIKYFDEYGKDVTEHMVSPITGSDLTDIRQLHLTLEVQSSARVYGRPGSDGRFIRSIWEKRFSPANLEDI